MRRCQETGPVAFALLAAMLMSSAAAQSGAKALFDATPGSTQNPRGPVGIHYWFEDAREAVRGGEVGVRLAEPAEAGAGARVRLHVQANTDGFLSVWLADGPGEGTSLTPWDGRYGGYAIAGRREQVIPADIAVPATPANTSVIILFSRSQTEQVSTVAQAREKLRHVSNLPTPDGGPPIVVETETTTPGEIGTYVVHRFGAQPAVEIELAP